MTPSAPPARSAESWPGLFEILTCPRAYTSLLLLGLIFPFGLAVFIWVVTALSLSLGLLVLIIGFPLLVLALGSFRALARLHDLLVEALTGQALPPAFPVLPRAEGFWKRLGLLFTDSGTWRALLLLLCLFPLGIAYFAVLVTGFSLSVALTLAPLVQPWADLGLACGRVPLPLWAAAGLSALGLMLGIGLLHLGLALGRFQALLSRGLRPRK